MPPPPASEPALPVARLAALGLAAAVYGVFGAPAPSHLGLPEAVTAALLLTGFGTTAVLATGTGALLLENNRLAAHGGTGLIALHGLLWLPLLIGVCHGWRPMDILRDVAPLLFLFLPVVAAAALPAEARGHDLQRALDGGLVLAGLALAVRWWHAAGWSFDTVGRSAMDHGTDYLLNAPAVAYAGIRLAGLAIDRLARPGPGPLGLVLGGLATAGAGLVLAALAGTVHRTALAVSLAVIMVLAVRSLRRSGRVLVLLLATMPLAVLGFPDQVLGIADQTLMKTAAFGWNARDLELAAVIDRVGSSVPEFLFGTGWGSLLANPAVGGMPVSFTHNFASYLLLKAGLAGVLLATVYLLRLIPAVAITLRADPPLALAAAAALTGGLFFHTSFKYLDFGLLLTLLTVRRRDG